MGKKTLGQYINEARKVHGDKYDYSKVNYVHSMSGVCITCPTHGDFWMTPNAHLQNHGCPKCIGLNKTTEEWVKEAKEIHGNKYDYSKVEYVGSNHKVEIICPKHGEFWQYASHHLQGRGCPHCRQSSLEKEVREFLEKENIEYVAQKRGKWLGKQSLDFYLPQYNMAIECQGIQHFKPVSFSQTMDKDESFKVLRERDKLKLEKAKENRIKVIFFSDCNYKTFLGEDVIHSTEELMQFL
jgi:very-short-patch-repair endonuclease